MKRLFATLLVLMLAVSGLAMAEEDASVENILEKGTFILGLDDSFPPMGFRDENNDIVGFDIDVAKEVAARLGVEFIAQPSPGTPRSWSWPPAPSTASGTACPSRPNGRKAWP